MAFNGVPLAYARNRYVLPLLRPQTRASVDAKQTRLRPQVRHDPLQLLPSHLQLLALF